MKGIEIDMKSGKFLFISALFICVASIFMMPPRAESAGSALFPKIGTLSESVKEVFERISTDGTKIVMKIDGKNWPNVEEASNHIQGYAYYKNLFHIFSHSDNKDYGRLIFVSTTGEVKNNVEYKPDKVYTVNTPLDKYNHVGGIQIIGDYLLVGTAKDDKHGKIWLYDLTTINTSDPGKPFLGDPKLLRDNIPEASAVGVTDITLLNNNTVSADKSVYAVGVLSGKELVLYSSNAVDTGKIMDVTSLQYQNRYIFDTSGEYQSIGLFCAADKSLCMVGFRAISTGSWKDEYDVYQLTDKEGFFRENPRILLNDVHVTCHHGAMPGSYGVHFRWGAGFQIIGDGEYSSQIRLFATQRNHANSEVAINVFSEAEGSEPVEPGGPSTSGKGSGCDSGVGIAWALLMLTALLGVRKRGM